jgi:hypothetical protein
MRGWAADVLTDPVTVVAGILLFVLAALLFRPIARRLGTPTWAAAGLLASAAAVAMLTLLPAPGHGVLGPSADTLAACGSSLGDVPGLWRGLVARDSIGERVGNFVMFVPLAFFATLAVSTPRGRRGRLLLLAALAVAAPVVIEVGQALLGAGRTCAGYDWVNNALGGLAGVAIGAVMLVTIRQNER